MMFLNQLYEKYRAELRADALTAEGFAAVFGERLRTMHRVIMDDASGRGVLYYHIRDDGSQQFCIIPVYGYYADSEQVLIRLFTRLSAKLAEQKTTQYQVHLYARDHQAQRVFAMLQFGFMAETGFLKKELPIADSHPGVCIRTLPKDEIAERWDEIWSLTQAILSHLRQAPVFYPCDEFSEEVYRDFFLDNETALHGALDADGRMIGMIETNAEPNPMIQAQSANVGEVYVVPEYRGTGLADALLAFAQAYARSQGADALWVEHGTANPNARFFWGRHFESCEYEMDRTICKPM